MSNTVYVGTKSFSEYVWVGAVSRALFGGWCDEAEFRFGKKFGKITSYTFR